MEISLLKTRRNGKTDFKSLPVLSFKVLAKPDSVFVVRDGSMEIGDSEEEQLIDLLYIYKVDFIAACNTELPNAIPVAFFVDEHGHLDSHVLDTHIKGYTIPGKCRLIDYEGYQQIGEMTGETILSFKDYLYTVRTETVGRNTLLVYNGRLLNNNEQVELIASKEK